MNLLSDILLKAIISPVVWIPPSTNNLILSSVVIGSILTPILWVSKEKDKIVILSTVENLAKGAELIIPSVFSEFSIKFPV